MSLLENDRENTEKKLLRCQKILCHQTFSTMRFEMTIFEKRYVGLLTRQILGFVVQHFYSYPYPLFPTKAQKITQEK